jgi:MFS superfamily sulfate permease-like transporter/CRP-like cAMP-binding protein
MAELAALHEQSTFRAEVQGGVESTLLGISSSIVPILLFAGLLGHQASAAAFWATMVTVAVVPIVGLCLGGHPAVHASSRTASLLAYIGLVMQLGLAADGASAATGAFSPQQLVLGLAAGSVLFTAASCLIVVAGFLKLGNIFKMIPSTVTAGIGNSSALLLVWLAAQQLLHSVWLEAFTAGAMLLCYLAWPPLQSRVRLLLHVPATLASALIGIAIAMGLAPSALGGYAPATVETGWLAIGLWPALLDHDLGHLLIVGLPGAVALALVMILETFTTIALMETRHGLSVDANRQLLVLGGSNLVGAVLGGVPCTASPIRCLASWNSGARGSLAALTGAVLTGALVLVLSSWLLSLPAGVMAGLFLLQAPFMVDTLFLERLKQMAASRSLHTAGATDLGFWITVVISLAGFFGSLIWACFLGIGLSALAVLRRVSRNLTAQWAYMDQYRSRRVRSASQSNMLGHLRCHVGILRLTGHLFFGNSTRLTQLVAELDGAAVAVVIDVSRVHDVDPSGLSALQWVVRALADRKLMVVLTGVQHTTSRELKDSLHPLMEVEQRVDLDRGLELCEEWVLRASMQNGHTVHAVALEQNQLLDQLDTEEIAAVLALGERREVAPGEVLFKQHAVADGLWLLEDGTVSILAGNSGPDSPRLATVGPGQFVGEMGYIDGKLRSATARADTAVRAMHLDKAAIATLIEHRPITALTITRNIARELSNRVRNASILLADDVAATNSEGADSTLSSFSRL